jgi:hypothetical protein
MKMARHGIPETTMRRAVNAGLHIAQYNTGDGIKYRLFIHDWGFTKSSPPDYFGDKPLASFNKKAEVTAFVDGFIEGRCVGRVS